MTLVSTALDSTSLFSAVFASLQFEGVFNESVDASEPYSSFEEPSTRCAASNPSTTRASVFTLGSSQLRHWCWGSAWMDLDLQYPSWTPKLANTSVTNLSLMLMRHRRQIFDSSVSFTGYLLRSCLETPLFSRECKSNRKYSKAMFLKDSCISRSQAIISLQFYPLRLFWWREETLFLSFASCSVSWTPFTHFVIQHKRHRVTDSSRSFTVT